MTGEMLDLARRNATEAGITNVEFHKGPDRRVASPDASNARVIADPEPKALRVRDVAARHRPGSVVAWLERVNELIAELRAGVDEDGCRLATVATGFVATFFTVNGQPRFSGIPGPPGLREAHPAMFVR